MAPLSFSLKLKWRTASNGEVREQVRRGRSKQTARSSERHYFQDRNKGLLGQSPPPLASPWELLETNALTEQALCCFRCSGKAPPEFYTVTVPQAKMSAREGGVGTKVVNVVPALTAFSTQKQHRALGA